MSLSHALLTSLLDTPSSGYDLARRFTAGMGSFWNAKHQQIYRELAQMEEAGWISASEEQHRRKKEYSVLPAGKAELMRWMEQPSPPVQVRIPMAVKLSALALLDSVDLRPQLQEDLIGHQTQLEELKQLYERSFANLDESDRKAAIHAYLLRQGILYEKRRIGWCRDAIKVLNKLEQTPAPDRGLRDASSGS